MTIFLANKYIRTGTIYGMPGKARQAVWLSLDRWRYNPTVGIDTKKNLLAGIERRYKKYQFQAGGSFRSGRKPGWYIGISKKF